MAITTPDAVPGEVIEAAWGDAVRADLTMLDTTRVKKAGDTMTGLLTIDGPVGSIVARSPEAGYGIIEFYGGVTRRGWVGREPSNGNIALVSDSGHVLLTASQVGKYALAGSDPYTTAPGVALDKRGNVTNYTATSNLPNTIFMRNGAAFAAGQLFEMFCGGSTGNVLGSITQAGPSSVAYNTSSDKRLKSVTRPVEPTEAVAKVQAMAPINFTWKAEPGGNEQTGFLAQDLHPIAPEAVTPGHGELGEAGSMPWQVDLTALVPTLVAALQSLTARITELEGATA